MTRRVVIDLGKWRCGGGRDDLLARFGRTYLRNEDGYCCCLGFACEQSGVSPEFTLNIGMPKNIAVDDKRIDWLIEFENEASDINDRLLMPNAEREQRLTALFAKHDCELVFEGEYP
jgi:hypothetical protein